MKHIIHNPKSHETCLLNASCVVEKPGQRRKIETCPDFLALVKNAVAEPSNEAAVSDSFFRGAYACLRCYRVQTSRKNCQTEGKME